VSRSRVPSKVSWNQAPLIQQSCHRTGGEGRMARRS
jgi:hypothetical protein